MSIGCATPFFVLVWLTRRMAVMNVWFSFPESLYTDMSNSRLLFDSVNEVIERTYKLEKDMAVVKEDLRKMEGEK